MKVRISYLKEDKPLIYININGEVFKVKKVYITSLHFGIEIITNKGDKDIVKFIEAVKATIEEDTCYIIMF